jgi:hypothetical protein
VAKYKRKWQIEVNPNNMSKGQAEAAMLAGELVQHESWAENEMLRYSRVLNSIIDEHGNKLGNFDDVMWSKEQKQQWGWKIVQQ